MIIVGVLAWNRVEFVYNTQFVVLIGHGRNGQVKKCGVVDLRTAYTCPHRSQADPFILDCWIDAIIQIGVGTSNDLVVERINNVVSIGIFITVDVLMHRYTVFIEAKKFWAVERRERLTNPDDAVRAGGIVTPGYGGNVFIVLCFSNDIRIVRQVKIDRHGPVSIINYVCTQRKFPAFVLHLPYIVNDLSWPRSDP